MLPPIQLNPKPNERKREGQDHNDVVSNYITSHSITDTMSEKPDRELNLTSSLAMSAKGNRSNEIVERSKIKALERRAADRVRNRPVSHDPNRNPKLKTVKGKLDQCDDQRPRWIANRMPNLLNDIRKEHTVEIARNALRDPLPAFTVFENATGGCLDTMAAAIVGFRHLGGSENLSTSEGRAKASMFTDLTDAPCHDDALQWRKWSNQIDLEINSRIDYYKAGMPCPNYASLGDHKGSEGSKGGDLFIAQIEFIRALKPRIVRLEITPDALKTNNGKEVSMVIENLMDMNYVVHSDVLNVWHYGDPSHRARLFIIGIDKEIDKVAKWSWPTKLFNDTYYPTARDISTPDCEVHGDYWRDDEIILNVPSKLPKPGKLHNIGHSVNQPHVSSPGFSDNPHRVQGWDGMLSTQTTTNGISRRPTLDWRQGQPIGRTRLSDPVMTMKAASLEPDSYKAFAGRHHHKATMPMNIDQWIQHLVNNGVPLCTGVAIDDAIHNLLIQANIQPSTCPQSRSARLTKSIKYMLPAHPTEDDDVNLDLPDLLCYPCNRDDESERLARNAYQVKEERDDVTFGIADSGASEHLGEHNQFSSHLTNSERDCTRFATAGDDTNIESVLKGDVDMAILNIDGLPNEAPIYDHKTQMKTVKGIGVFLFSLDYEYNHHGYDIRLTHGYSSKDRTGMYRPPEADQLRVHGKVFGPESFIPLLANWGGQGGWRVPFVCKKPGTDYEQLRARLTSLLQEHEALQAKSARNSHFNNSYPLDVAHSLNEFYWACPAVEEQIVVRVPGERNIRPAFSYGGLKRSKNLSWSQCHDHMNHFGEPKGRCVICDMFKGAPRRISRNPRSKPREQRPGHTWHMDMIVFPDRSEEGCKYLIVLTDEATQFYQLLPLYFKSDATFEVRRWIRRLRDHPAFIDISYGIVSNIITDNDGAWSEDNDEWQSMIRAERGIEMIYADPQDHARDNAKAEGANKIIEAGICSLLYSKNLPSSWWQRAASDVMFVANRFPPYSIEGRTPPDGDSPSPIESLFLGYVSRHQVYRELDCYIGVGTPALCKVSDVKGSSLEPRVRWGIAIGQRGKITRFMDPYIKSIFRTRSFHAHVLRVGLNYSQFLGLGEIVPDSRSRMLPGDELDEKDERVMITLPQVKKTKLELPPPISEIISKDADEGIIVRKFPKYGKSNDLIEYLPEHSNWKQLERMRIPTGDAHTDSSDEDVEVKQVEAHQVVDAEGNNILIDRPTAPLEGDNDINTEAQHYDGHSHHDHQRDKREPAPIVTHSPDSSDQEIEDNPRPKGAKTRPKGKGDRFKGIGNQPNQPDPKQPSIDEEFDLDFEIQIEPPELNSEDRNTMERLEARQARKYTIRTDGRMAWGRICRNMHKVHKELPHELENHYRLWLLTKPLREGETKIRVQDLPKSLTTGNNYRKPLKAGLELYYPSGPHWNTIKSSPKLRAQLRNELPLEEQSEDVAYAAQWYYHRSLDYEHPEINGLHTASTALIAQQMTHHEFESILNEIVKEEIEEHGAAHVAKRVSAMAAKGNKRTKIADHGDPAPKTMVEALMSDRADEWVTSIHKEFTGLLEQGVFSLGWTAEDLREAGILGKPVPCSIALTHKYKDGILEKLKTRICIAGHPGNVTKGIHYHDVFSPSPVQHTERMLQAMLVHLKLFNLAWDIKQAYTWADLPEGERIAVVMPEGFKDTNAEGKPLYAVLVKNLYGMPNAARGWGKCRDEFIRDYFSKNQWKVSQSKSDPCLWVIDKIVAKGKGYSNPILPSEINEFSSSAKWEFDKESGKWKFTTENPDPMNRIRTWMLIHTDDCGQSPKGMD
ncbi:MAG: hypothetical protein HOI09_00965 [Porticoccaceae bacterium]|nr:hypothetical protein [Porticoccaceae bacterium]